MSEWHIIKGANDILICGPGNLIISLREFDRKKVEVIDKDVMGMTTLVSRVRYPLDDKIALELTMLSSGSNSQIKLHVGDRIQWTIPKDVAQSLKNILTAAAVYSQSNVKKSTGVLKSKKKAKAQPKHTKISGRALLKAQEKTTTQAVEKPAAAKGKRGRKPALVSPAVQPVLEPLKKGPKGRKPKGSIPTVVPAVTVSEKPKKEVKKSVKKVDQPKSTPKKNTYKSKKNLNVLQSVKPQLKDAKESKKTPSEKPIKNAKKPDLKTAKPLSAKKSTQAALPKDLTPKNKEKISKQPKK